MNNMDRIAIVYKSKYGSTLRYANWMADRLVCPIAPLGRVDRKQLRSYDTVILIGRVKAGKIKGRKLFRKNPELVRDKNCYIVAVGASPASPELLGELRRDNLTDGLEGIPLYYVRGAIDSRKFSKKDKATLALLRKFLPRRLMAAGGEEAWIEPLLNKGEVCMDWTDPHALDEILRDVLAALPAE